MPFESASESQLDAPSAESPPYAATIFDQPNSPILIAQESGQQAIKDNLKAAEKPESGKIDISKLSWAQGLELYADGLQKLEQDKEGGLKALRQSVKILQKQLEAEFTEPGPKAAAAETVASAMFDFGVALGKKGPGQTEEELQGQRREADKIFSEAQKYNRNMRPIQQALLWNVAGENIFDMTNFDFNAALTKAQEQLVANKNQEQYAQAYKKAASIFQPEMERAIKNFGNAAEITKAFGGNSAFQAKAIRDLANAEMARANELNDSFSQNSARHFGEAWAVFAGLVQDEDEQRINLVKDKLAGKITTEDFSKELQKADKIDGVRLDTLSEWEELLNAQLKGYKQLQDQQNIDQAEAKLKKDISLKVADFDKALKQVKTHRETVRQHTAKLKKEFEAGTVLPEKEQPMPDKKTEKPQNRINNFYQRQRNLELMI